MTDKNKYRVSNAPDPAALQEWFDKAIKNAGKPCPVYSSRCSPKTNLHYDCTVWLSGGEKFPVCTSDIIMQVKPLWKKDGLTFEKYDVQGDKVQILFFAKHDVAPVTFVARIKGRLQHALREAGMTIKFSRKVSFRSLGDNISGEVTGYLKKQASKEGFADSDFAKRMENFTVINEGVNLAEPVVTTRGRYWYNVHLVLVTSGRFRFAQNEQLAMLRDGCVRVAEKKGYRLKSVAVMLDHIHIALGGIPEHSAEDIALAFMNNLAWLLGNNRVWQDGYYIGSFSEYALKDLPFQRGKPAGDA
ncbi:MAG: transposase [Kiritimatiellae bacterium]|nr:transposase [Kiritimatiellia bacterium]